MNLPNDILSKKYQKGAANGLFIRKTLHVIINKRCVYGTVLLTGSPNVASANFLRLLSGSKVEGHGV